MKRLAIRMGEEYHDHDDIAALLEVCKLCTIADAESVLARYYALDRYPVRARYVLEELLERANTDGPS
jgi:hypothetical protein